MFPHRQRSMSIDKQVQRWLFTTSMSSELSLSKVRAENSFGKTQGGNSGLQSLGVPWSPLESLESRGVLGVPWSPLESLGVFGVPWSPLESLESRGVLGVPWSPIRNVVHAPEVVSFLMNFNSLTVSANKNMLFVVFES